MRLDFYYWAAMCPLNMEMLALLQAYSSRLEIHTYDISVSYTHLTLPTNSLV